MLNSLIILIFQIASFITITQQDDFYVLKNALDGKKSYVIGLMNKADTEGPLADITDFKEGKKCSQIIAIHAKCSCKSVNVKMNTIIGFFILNPILSDLAILCKFGL